MYTVFAGKNKVYKVFKQAKQVPTKIYFVENFYN